MYEKGHQFFKTASAIWLTKEVPVEYIKLEGESPALSD
jgi:RNA:NAD 2'-phosphotransferase (TPT1/KptA family)